MQDADLSLGEWPCGSWDITVGMKALLIADTRLQGGDAPIYVVQVGDVEGLSPATMARLASRLRTRSSNSSNSEPGLSRWSKVRSFVTFPITLRSDCHQQSRAQRLDIVVCVDQDRDGKMSSGAKYLGLNAQLHAEDSL